MSEDTGFQPELPLPFPDLALDLEKLDANLKANPIHDANTFLDLFVGNSGNNRTGWKNERYDTLIREANDQTDLKKRAEIFRQAETILVTEEAPIVPLYFYAGFNYFDPNKIQGIWQNILDEHPMQYIYKKGRSGRREEAHSQSRIDQSLLTSGATDLR